MEHVAMTASDGQLIERLHRRQARYSIIGTVIVQETRVQLLKGVDKDFRALKVALVKEAVGDERQLHLNVSVDGHSQQGGD